MTLKSFMKPFGQNVNYYYVNSLHYGSPYKMSETILENLKKHQRRRQLN